MSTLPELAGRLVEDPSSQVIFAERLDQIVEQLRNQQRQFEAYLEENPELEELLSIEVDDINERMDEYEEALESIEAQLENGELASIQEFAELAFGRAHTLRLSWDRFLQAREAALGPTAMGQINYIVQLGEEMLRGELPPNFLGMLVRKEEQQIQLALLSADENIGFALKDLKARLGAFADDVDRNGPRAQTAQHLEAIILAANQVTQSQGISQIKKVSEGPTCLASVNLVLHGFESWRRGELHPEQLVNPLQSFYQIVPQLISLAPSVAQTGQAILHEEALKLQEIVQNLEEEIMALEESVFADEEGDWDGTVAEIIALCEEFATINSAVEKLAEMEGKVPCVSCGHYNPQERSQCEKCLAVLPKAAQERVAQIDVVAQQGGIADSTQETAGLKMTENFKRLFSSIDEFLEGRVGAKQLLRELQRTEVLAKRVKAVKLDIADMASGAELKALHRQSTRGFVEALNVLIEGCQEEDLGKVEQGRSALWDGAVALQDLQSRLAQQ